MRPPLRRRTESSAKLWVGCVIVAALATGYESVGAQRAKPAPPPPKPAAPAPMPQITVAGIRIVGAGFGANATELRAFNEEAGTTIALAIAAPAGSGIVEIDNRASRLESFADDRGQNLLEEGRIGSFPKIADDGSAGLVEIEVRGRPSAGSTSLTTQGTIVMTLAGGSKPQRMANVRLEPLRTLKLGSAAVTLKTVTAGDESTTVTFALPRSVMNSIREVRFFDPKGAVIESRRTGSGYMNDAAEFEMDVKSKEKVVAIEFDVWQNLRQTKVPFNITATLALPGGGRPAGTTDPPPSERIAKPLSTTPTIAPAPGEGAPSVEAVVKQMQSAAAAGRARDLLAVIYPDDRGTFAQGIATIVAFSTLASLKDEKASEKAQKDVDALFDKHKVKPPLIRDPADIFKETDLGAFVTDALALLRSVTKKGDKPLLPLPTGPARDVTINGDSATASVEGNNVDFTRVNGRWFLRIPQ